MKINILSPSLSSLDTSNNGANVQGDELVARAWYKYLLDNPKVEYVRLNGSDYLEYDFCINFNPYAQSLTNGLPILYLQNAFPDSFDGIQGGTISTYNQYKQKYKAFIYTSDGLKKCFGEDGLVLQFAVDPELYYHDPDSNWSYSTCFVGNNIRDSTTTNKYILCARNHNLGLFGNPYSWNDSLCKGKISIDDERKLYSSSLICLNAHLNDHLKYGTYNFRIYSILACGGFVMSDWSEQLQNEFSGCIDFSQGYQDLIDKIIFYTKNPEQTFPFRNKGRDHVLNNHTFAHRMNNLVSWLENLKV